MRTGVPYGDGWASMTFDGIQARETTCSSAVAACPIGL